MSMEAAAQAISAKMVGSTALGASVKFDCGEDGVVFIDGNAGTVTTNNGDADCTIKCDKDVLDDLIAGDLDPTAAFMQGKLKVEGDMSVAMKLSSVL